MIEAWPPWHHRDPSEGGDHQFKVEIESGSLTRGVVTFVSVWCRSMDISLPRLYIAGISRKALTRAGVGMTCCCFCPRSGPDSVQASGGIYCMYRSTSTFDFEKGFFDGRSFRV